MRHENAAAVVALGSPHPRLSTSSPAATSALRLSPQWKLRILNGLAVLMMVWAIMLGRDILGELAAAFSSYAISTLRAALIAGDDLEGVVGLT